MMVFPRDGFFGRAKMGRHGVSKSEDEEDFHETTGVAAKAR
jgi:hypothetical protein